MDMNGKDSSSGKNKPLNVDESPNSEVSGEKDDDDESKSLLSSKKGGLLKSPRKPGRKVQWNDKNGDKLAEVLEFEPSDASDSDDDDNDSDTCLCTIM